MIPRMLEEALRFDGPLLGVWRRAGPDAEIDGIQIEENARVYCIVGAANRDPEVYPDPDSFSPMRDNLRQVITFGRGPHTCIGASLARLEGRIAFEVLVERLPGIRLAQEKLTFGENATLRVPEQLLLEWDV
jgi:cytochrome P450